MKFSNLKTQGFAATRTRLGFSQRQLAEQLGISKTAIGMAETGRRNLPVAALLRLAELEIKMAAVLVPGTTTTVEETIMNQPTRITPGITTLRELQCDVQIQKLATRLESMTTNYKRFQLQLRLLEAMLEKEPEEPGNMFILFMKMHRDRILKQLSKCSLMEQALLRNRIALLRAESHLNRSVKQQFMDHRS